MTKWHERAKIIADDRARTTSGFQAELAKKMGTVPVDVSRILNGKRSADSIQWMLQFATALDVDPCYLLFGEEYQRPIKKISHKLLIEKLEKFEVYEEGSPFATTKYAAIRLLKDSIAAGHPTEIREQDIDGWALIYASKEWMPHDAEFYTCARITGYSMYPVLAPGDIVAIDHLEREPENLADKMVAFREGQGATVKWLRFYRDKHLIIGEPENRDERNTTLIFEADEAYDQIIGRVAWWWAKR
jgi:transcriptional regulator with XRE-family HTH domain